MAPDSPEPYNALGWLAASAGRPHDAEMLYLQALAKDLKSVPARHNLVLLLAGRKDGAAEAIQLWREILGESPEFLPSRISLADVVVTGNLVALVP